MQTICIKSKNLSVMMTNYLKRIFLLNELYSQALEHAKEPAQLKSSQRDWVLKVRNRCNTVSCLMRVYEGREIYLGTLLLPSNHLDIRYEWNGIKEYKSATKSDNTETRQFTKTLQQSFNNSNKKDTVISCDDVWWDHAGRINAGYGGICWAEIEGQLSEYYICYNEVSFHYEPVIIRNEYLAVRHLLKYCYGG